MIIIPAIDIQSGQCVRLLQGRKDDATVFSDDPAAMARRWVEAGAQLIHASLSENVEVDRNPS
jgi:phosphoribosylformimino-5-aminoimidazole carboxamide ribotide isomerase